MSEETNNQNEIIVRRDYYDALLAKAAERDAMMTKVYLLAQERDKASEEARQYSARCDELAREVEQWQADRNVLQGHVDRLRKSQVAMATHLHETQTALVEAEIAIRAMWPVFALALAYGEHGRASEHNGLRKLAEEARNGGVPTHVMDTILDAAEGR